MVYPIFQSHLRFLEKAGTSCGSGSDEHKPLEQPQEVHREQTVKLELSLWGRDSLSKQG